MKVGFDETKVNLEQYVPDENYKTGFSLVPIQALECSSKMSFISTTDACHITHANINGMNMYTTCHDANYQINPMIGSYSLFEESEITWNVHNSVDLRKFPIRNTPDHVHISDGDKGGFASYKKIYTAKKHKPDSQCGHVYKLHKGFFYCSNHAAQTVRKKYKSAASDEFNHLKRMTSRDKILARLEDPKHKKLCKWLSKRSLEFSLPAFNDQIWDKDTTQNVEVQNKLQKSEGARTGGHMQRAQNMLSSMMRRWIRKKKNAVECKTILVPKMEIEKKRLISKISGYFSHQKNPSNPNKGVVEVYSGIKDQQLSKKCYEVELYPNRHPYTTMGGHCSCLRPLQKRLPCVHTIYYAGLVGFEYDNLFREEHLTKYWRWQYEDMGTEMLIPDVNTLIKSSSLAAPVVGAPLRGRPKKGKRIKSVMEKRKRRRPN